MALTIHDCLLNLVPCGHHEWTVLHDVLVERLSGDLSILHECMKFPPTTRMIHTRMKSVLSIRAATETPVS